MSRTEGLRFLVAVLITLSVPFSGDISVAAGKRGATLEINFDAASVPTMYAAGNDEAIGIYPAIVRAAFAQMNAPVHVSAKPQKRLLADLANGQAAAGALIDTPERRAYGEYSAAFINEKVELFLRRGDDMLLREASQDVMTALAGKRVGVIRGWAYGTAFDQARRARFVDAQDADSDAQNFAKLKSGRLDAVLAIEMAGRVLLADPRYQQISGTGRYLVSIGIHLVLPNREPGSTQISVARQQANRQLLRRFNAAVDQLKRRGLIEPLIEREVSAAARLQRPEISP